MINIIMFIKKFKVQIKGSSDNKYMHTEEKHFYYYYLVNNVSILFSVTFHAVGSM